MADPDLSRSLKEGKQISKYAGLKFLSFSKLVESVGGDNAKFSRRLMHDTNNGEMFFTEALTKWNDQDHGARFAAFVDEIPTDELQTYAQLLHHKDVLATTLLRHMNNDVENNASLPAFCELLAALARDLKDEFFDYLWSAFDSLTNVFDFCALENDNAEAAFYCLSLLVKIFWKKLGKSIKKTFTRFIPFFSSSRSFVRRFASEAFAFLMRKLPDLREISKFIISQAHKAGDNRLRDGVATLFFNVCKGVNGGFHSAAAEQLRDILEGGFSIENEDVRAYGAEVLQEMIEKCVTYVKDTKTGDLQVVELVLLNAFENSSSMSRVSLAARLIPLLFVVRGRTPLFTAGPRLLTAFNKVMGLPFFVLADEFVDLITESIVHVFNTNISNNGIRELFSKLVSLNSEDSLSRDGLLLDIFHNLHPVQCFDLTIMPAVAVLAQRVTESEHILLERLMSLYALICSNRKPILDVVGRPRTSFFNIERHVPVKNFVIAQLSKLSSMPISMAVDIVITWPWLFTSIEKPIGMEHVKAWLRELLDTSVWSADISQAAFIVAASLYQLDKKSLTEIDASHYEQFITSQKCTESSIRLYSLYIVVTGQQTSVESLIRVAKLLSPAYFCVSAARRIAAMEILSSFDVVLEGKGDLDQNGELLPEPENAFSILLSAEKAELTNFKDRLMYFRKLRHGGHIRCLPKGHVEDLEHIILRLALSQFFVQFAPVWPGMHEIISSFGRGMKFDNFWNCVGPAFQEVHENCFVVDDMLDSKPSQFAGLIPGVDSFNRRNFLTARIEMLKYLTSISDLAERRTKMLSPMLLRLYKEEFLNKMNNEKPIVRADENENNDDNAENDEELNDENEETLDDKLDVDSNALEMTRGDLYKAMCAFLKLFSSFVNPKAAWNHVELKTMYYKLLTFRVPDIQKAVLDCIYTYNDKHLKPYKEHLDKMLDKSGFYNELVRFTINEKEEGGCVLQAQDREAVMPVLLRLIYGKMCEKKKAKFMRKTPVFRYLAYCRPSELQIFINVVFEPIISVCGDAADMYENMQTICNEPDRLQNIHLAGVKDSLANVGEMVRACNTVMVDEQATLLYRLLMTTSLVVHRVFEIERTNGNQQRLKQAKELRVLLSDTIISYFHGFTLRSYSTVEMQQLLDTFVLGYVERCHADSEGGVQLPIVPMTVTRLMASWTELPPLFHLFALRVQPPGETSSMTLMDLFINPLLWSACNPSAQKIIRDAVWKLLTLADETSHTAIDMDRMDIPIIPKENFGTSLVVAHLDKVLKFLACALETERLKRKISEQNLNIINRLSDFVSDGELGDRMADTLVAYLEHSLPKNTDVLQKMLYTIGRLLAHVARPEEYIVRIAPMWSKVEGEGRTCRSALAGVVRGLINNKNMSSDLKPLLQNAIDLDSWDRSKMDEPDHDKRHAAYSRLNEIWASSDKIRDDIITMYAHSHYFTLTHTTDLVLRGSSSLNLRTLIEYVGRIGFEEAVTDKLLQKHLIPLVLRGLKYADDIVRDEAVRALTTLVDVFPEDKNMLPMVPLRYKDEKDEDLDFFVNIIHIQTHRRQRAITRLVDELATEKVVIPYAVLFRFILPIVEHYLIASDSKYSALSDASLRLLNHTMGLASWPAYSSCVDQWLGRLNNDGEREKPIVRVVVAVIESFHFDVANVRDKLLEDGSNELPIKIRDHICRTLLPRLQTCINGKAAALRVHSKAETANTRYYYEDEDILRAPIALATVKLLKRTPESVMKQHIHGVVLKLCSLMISRSINVRETARKIMVQAVQCLSVRYLPFIIKEMKYILTKGFQLHVMIYTVNVLIKAMESDLKTGDLDLCLEDILDASVKDQFEGASEEKEIAAIRGKTSEAKSNKTPETFFLLGKFISGSALGLVLDKLSVVIDTKTSSKVVLRIGQLLHKFAIGVKENAGLTPALQLIFVHQVLAEKVAKMEQLNDKSKPTEDNGFRSESCLIIPKAPRRLGSIVKTSVKSRVHVFVEFALQLLSHLVKGKCFNMADAGDVARLDPFVSIVTRCLTLKYEKIILYSLHCINGLLLINLPSVRSQLKSMTERLFVLLADYSSLTTTGGQQTMLHVLIFKSFTQIISLSEASFMTKKHMSLLLSYAEADVLDNQRHATALSLIKAVVKKMIVHDQLPEVMKLLSELAITHGIPSVRAQCRDTICEYIGNHPSSGDPRTHLEFYCAQLEYEFEDGRLSAADVLHHLFGNLLQKVLDENCMFCLVKLAARLVNDESPKCRKFVAAALRKLLEGIGEGSRADVASAAFDWMESPKEASRAVGVEVMVQLSYVEGPRFSARLPRLVTIIDDRLCSDEVLKENGEPTLVSIMDGLTVILQNCDKRGIQTVADLQIFNHLCLSLGPLVKYLESLEVRRATTAYIGQCLSMWPSPLRAENDMPSVDLLLDWMCWQLKDWKLTDALATQASKNVVCLSTSLDDESFELLCKKLAGICLFEISRQNKEAIKRITCFKLAAAIAVREQSGPRYESVVTHFLPLFVRELNRKSAANTEELYSLAVEIGEVLKKQMGEQEYSDRIAKCQKEAILKTEDRKRKLKEMVVTDPVEAAELKRKKNAKKILSRKRKIDAYKPYRVGKRAHMENERLRRDDDDE